MGIDTSACLIWGVEANELEYDEEVWDDLYEYVEGMGLDRASPYYDSDIYENIIGIPLGYACTYGAREIDAEGLPEAISNAASRFKELTGLEGRLYLSPHIT